MKRSTKIASLLCALTLAAAAAPALAGDAPGTPPPATGIVTPLTGDRDSSLDYPPASPAPAPERCPGQRLAVKGPVGRESVNGAIVPTGSARGGSDWCAGKYDPAAGTNFSAD